MADQGVDRFFSATAMAGRLHVNDIGERASWDATRILYWSEPDVNAIMPRMIIAKVQTVEQLDAEIARSQGRPGSISLFVHESLVEAARARWEKMQENLRAPASDDLTSSS